MDMSHRFEPDAPKGERIAIIIGATFSALIVLASGFAFYKDATIPAAAPPGCERIPYPDKADPNATRMPTSCPHGWRGLAMN